MFKLHLYNIYWLPTYITTPHHHSHYHRGKEGYPTGWGVAGPTAYIYICIYIYVYIYIYIDMIWNDMVMIWYWYWYIMIFDIDIDFDTVWFIYAYSYCILMHTIPPKVGGPPWLTRVRRDSIHFVLTGGPGVRPHQRVANGGGEHLAVYGIHQLIPGRWNPPSLVAG